jgi:uncharacterized protein (TIGR00369 family)
MTEKKPEKKMGEKKPEKTEYTVIQQMTQQDANLAGNVHGGTIMKLIDNTAGIVAVRHARKNAVTASIDRLDFHHPVFVGDLLKVMASVNYVGRTSMEIGVRVESENMLTGDSRHTASAYLTFVALDEHSRPSEIPPFTPQTETDIRQHNQAKERRKLRMRERKCEKSGDCG